MPNRSYVGVRAFAGALRLIAQVETYLLNAQVGTYILGAQGETLGRLGLDDMWAVGAQLRSRHRRGAGPQWWAGDLRANMLAMISNASR